jgi:hypothetical protein
MQLEVLIFEKEASNPPEIDGGKEVLDIDIEHVAPSSVA